MIFFLFLLSCRMVNVVFKYNYSNWESHAVSLRLTIYCYMITFRQPPRLKLLKMQMCYMVGSFSLWAWILTSLWVITRTLLLVLKNLKHSFGICHRTKICAIPIYHSINWHGFNVDRLCHSQTPATTLQCFMWLAKSNHALRSSLNSSPLHFWAFVKALFSYSITVPKCTKHALFMHG